MFLVKNNVHNSRYVVVSLLNSVVSLLQVCVECGQEWR